MAKLTRHQLEIIGEKIMEWGNLVFAGMVISQFVPGIEFNMQFAMLGYLSLITAYFVATQIMRKGGDSR